MIEWPLIFLGGMLGSSHCVGMCGGLVVAIGASTTHPLANLRRQLCFSAGRIFTYGAAGAIVGFVGERIASHSPAALHASSLLALTAGVLLVVQGCLAAGIVRWPQSRPGSLGASVTCLAASFFAPLVHARGPLSAVRAGMFTGLLPCGLVYANLALAASRGSLWEGAGVMIAFGLGTVPLLVAFGAGTSLLSLNARRRAYRLAAWCMIGVGSLAMIRAVEAITIPGPATRPDCPFCARESTPADTVDAESHVPPGVGLVPRDE